MNNNRNRSNITELISLLLLTGFASGAYYLWKRDQLEPIIVASEPTVEYPFPSTTTATASQSEKWVDTGGPAPGQIVTNKINIATGGYHPTNIKIKKGDTVTWESYDLGLIPNAVESDKNSPVHYSSSDLRAGDKFSQTFNVTGVFNWHDKYNGNLRGSVTVTE